MTIKTHSFTNVTSLLTFMEDVKGIYGDDFDGQYGPYVDWTTNSVTYNSNHCIGEQRALDIQEKAIAEAETHYRE